RDSLYSYPAGNTEEKFLIILSKIHLPSTPIVVTPCTTNKANRKYHPSCNHASTIFYLERNQDFFVNDTIVQLYIIDEIKSEKFEEKRQERIIELHASLKKETLQRLMKCVLELKEDIPESLHHLLF
ncbi:MAG: hypothetical protein AABZ02_06125, partial [Bacteroidota bacterium]